MTHPPNHVRGATVEAPTAFTGEEYDALADLFLGDSPAPAPPRTIGAARATPDTSRAVRIEGLIIGHLPVLASAWVTQYARHLAEREHRPVGLLRLRAGSTSVEIVLPATGGPPALPVATASFDDAVATVAREVGRWMVRVDELTEPRLVELEGIDAVTLLTGADEAAVVASYRTIKQLADGPDGPGTAAPFGVAVMGSTPERAREAADRLSRTAGMHLGRPVPLTACVPQIGPGRTVALFRGESSESGEALLARAIGIIRRAAPASSTPSPEHASPRTTSVQSPASCQVRLVTTPEADSHWDASPMETAGEAPDLATPDLAAHLPGLTAMATGSPYAPEVRVAFDAAGVVHLLAWASKPGAEQHAVRQLVEASAWAAAHDALLRLAAGRPASAVPAPPVLHLFTPDGRSVRRLLDAPIRVHVLAPVPAGARWVVADLN